MINHPRAGSILNRGAAASDSDIFLRLQVQHNHSSTSSSNGTLGTSTPSTVSRQKGSKRQRAGLAGWKRISTRKKIFIVGSFVTVAALAVGLGVGKTVAKKAASQVQVRAAWKPAIENTWQIQLNGPLTSMTVAAHNYDIDLFENNKTTIQALHQMNAKVICYFSAGTYEEWRPDAKSFDNSSVGNNLAAPGERWLDVRSPGVRSVMSARIKLAADKGCDGVDPDNIDGYSHKNTGFPLTKDDAIRYMEFLAGEAKSQSLAIGLKNGVELSSSLMPLMDWDINESCSVHDECDTYQPFIMAGRPVFHIEYVDGTDAVNLTTACNAPGTRGFSTLLKHQSLDGWFHACPL